MTDDDRALLLAVAKIVYAQGMGKILDSGKPMLDAIKKADPNFESELKVHPQYENTFCDGWCPVIVCAGCFGVIALIVVLVRHFHQ